jgi:hypothetical protein
MATHVIAFPAALQSKTAQPAVSFGGDYLARLRNGDDETLKHFNDHFRRLLRLKFWGQFNREQGEELANGVLAAVREKIAQGEPGDATLLPAFVLRICAALVNSATACPAKQCGVTREQLRAFLLRRSR